MLRWGYDVVGRCSLCMQKSRGGRDWTSSGDDAPTRRPERPGVKMNLTFRHDTNGTKSRDVEDSKAFDDNV